MADVLTVIAKVCAPKGKDDALAALWSHRPGRRTLIVKHRGL